MRPRTLLWGVAVLIVILAAGVAGWSLYSGRAAPTSGGQPSLDSLGAYGEVPDFALTERSGRRVTRADLLGKVWVANFIYTRCEETCPLQSARVAGLQADFAGQEDLRLVSITVDPERDTPPVLARYAERYRADAVRWLFLTGERAAIYRLAKEGFNLGVVDPGDQAGASGLGARLEPPVAFASHGSKGLVLHSSRFVLVDRRAKIRAYHRSDDEQSLQRLRRNLRTLLRE